jgi:HEPN domain-containing protein
MPKQKYPEVVKQWLQRANDDVHWAQTSLDDEIYYGACFVSQQAVEKILKSFLLYHNKKFPKIHDLPKLIHECAHHDKRLLVFLKKTAIVNDYYTGARYPALTDFQHFSKKQAQEACLIAQEVVEYVSKLIDIK